MGTATRRWISFARLRTLLWILYGLFPVLLGIVAIMDRHPDRYRTKVIIALAYFVPLAIIQSALPFCPCPHCGKPFFGGWRSDAFLRFFTTKNRRCLNCGTPWPNDQDR